MHDDGSKAAADERWHAMIDQYGRFLRRVVARLCPGRLGIHIEDVEQEARLRLWKAMQAEKKIDDPLSYLYKVAATATIDAVRRVRARREEPLEDPDGEAPRDALTATTASLEDSAGRGLLIQRIQQVLECLAPERQRALRLHLQGFTTREIADLHGWTEPKARNLVYRTLEDLRERLRTSGIQYADG
jgi:RNA polymerase sigma-70 factor (ECF subfamily)